MMKRFWCLSCVCLLWVLLTLSACGDFDVSDSGNTSGETEIDTVDLAKETESAKEQSAETDAEPELWSFQYPARLTADGSDLEAAMTMTGELKASPGKVFILCEGYTNPLEVALDIDGDGCPERLALSCNGIGAGTAVYQDDEQGVPTASEGEVWLWAGERALRVRTGATATRWRILGLCPDGEQILFGYQYLSETDGFVSTELYSCEEKMLICVFSDAADLTEESTMIAADGITAVSRMRIPLCEYSNDYLFTWTRAEDGTYVRQYGDVYEFLCEKKVKISKQVFVYSEADQSSESMVLEPQTVVFLKSDLGAQRKVYEDPAAAITGSMLKGVTWMYLRAEDGTEGWFPVDDGVCDTDGTSWMWYEVIEVLQ